MFGKIATENIEIFPLRQKPEWADTCAAWSFGEWGCQLADSGCALDGASLEKSQQRYRKSATEESLPTTWVCAIEGRPAGMISLKLDDHPDRKDTNPWLGSLFVHPKFRRRGVGQALCAHVEEAAYKDFGYKSLYLFTSEAKKFYERNGWKQIDTVRDPMGILSEGEPLMMKHLI